MSYLPYGESRSGTWTASAAVSLALHAALIAAMSSNLAQLVLKPGDEPRRPDIQITLEQTQTDQLADLPDRLRGLDDLPPPSAFDAFTPEDLPEALPGDDAFLPEAPDDLASAEAEDLDAAVADALDAAEADAAETLDTFDPAAPEPVADLVEAEPEDADAPDTVAPAEVAGDAPVAPDAVPAELADVAEPDIPAVAEATVAPETPAPEAPPDTQEQSAPDFAAATLPDVAPETATPELPAAEDAVAAAVPRAPDVVDDLSVPLPEADAEPEAVVASPFFSEDGTGAAAPIDNGAIDIGATPLPQLAQDVVAQAVPPATAQTAPDAAPVDIEAVGAEPEAAAAATPETDATTETVGPEQVAILSLPDPEPVAPAVPTPPEPQEPAIAGVPQDSAVVLPDDTIATTPVAPPPPAERVVRRVPRSPPTARDIAVANLIQRIRSTPAPDCVVALPRRIGADAIGLTLISAQDDTRAAYSDRLLTRPEDATIRQTPLLIDPRQCPVLGFIAANRDYPATRIGIRIERVEVPSGNRLSGTVTNVGQRNVTLFLVDNNGVVQSLDRFVAQQDGAVRFDVPVTRVGPRRDTRQLLLAVASDAPLDQLAARSGQRAEDAFGTLSAALVRDAALAVLAFDVR